MNKNLKLAIVGHGFVGKATDWGFNKYVTKFIVDPLHKTSISDLKDFNPEIVFICVPTPMDNDGSQDSSIIVNVIKELTSCCPNSIKVVLIKKVLIFKIDWIYNIKFMSLNINY